MTTLTEAQAQVLRHTGKTREQIVSLTGLSHHRVRAVRKELVELGLIEPRLNRDAGGRVCGWVYLPVETPAPAEEIQREVAIDRSAPHALVTVIGALCILAIGAVAWFAR